MASYHLPGDTVRKLVAIRHGTIGSLMQGLAEVKTWRTFVSNAQPDTLGLVTSIINTMPADLGKFVSHEPTVVGKTLAKVVDVTIKVIGGKDGYGELAFNKEITQFGCSQEFGDMFEIILKMVINHMSAVCSDLRW